MLKLICGPSGSGKTAALIEAIRADVQNGIRCFLLVPEQQAYISERDIPKELPSHAGRLFEVVHFSRLAEDVFREYGGVTQGSISPALKSLLMWDTLRSTSPLLKQYGKGSAKDVTLSTLLLQTVEELHLNGVDAQRMEEAAKELPANSALAKKLCDLALIDAILGEKIQTAFGNDPADKFIRMANILRTHRYFENCRLYIDSFTSFTAQEYAVLREILKQADRVTLSLCTDHPRSKLPHFESVTETAKRFSKMASEMGVSTETLTLPARTEAKPRALSVLERDLWRFDLPQNAKESLSPKETEAVRLVSCPNLYEEAEAAALYVLEQIQAGMRYGEIAIVVRDVETYRGVLDAALERYKIPYFLSESVNLSSKPLTRLILSALRAVSRHFYAQDVITLIKTGLAGVNVADAAMFEEYCETWHLSGSRFTDEVWSMNPDGLTPDRSPRAEIILEAANRTRKAVMDPLLKLEAAMRASSRLEDRCRALYGYLCDLQVFEQLSEQAKKELLANRRREASETVRLYRFVTESLLSLCKLLPEAELTVDELIAALSLLFSETALSSVPNLHDCVIIGSAATLRVENVKASLLLGLCEGEFPKSIHDSGVLTEGDKEALEEVGILLDSRAGRRSTEELLYVYRAVTKPSQKLYLSTVQAQIDGSQRTPSLAFTRVSYLLDKPAESFDLTEIRRALGAENFAEAQPILSAPAALSPTTLRLSQSKIRTFALCPFSYYSTYELKLREKKDSRPGYADDGLFLHYVFEHFLRGSLGEDGKLHLPTEEQIEQIAREIVERYVGEVCPIPPKQLDKRLLHLFARLRTMSVLMLKDIVSELRFSRFVPHKFEQIIGMPGPDGLPPVTLALANGSRVVLSGKVDRIDLCKEGDVCYVRVVDYKSGTHKFSLDEVRSGMDIQLVLYLYAVLSATEDALPGGAQFLYAASEKGKLSINRSGFMLDSVELSALADQTPDGTYSKKLLPRTEEEIDELIREMQEAVKAVGERILRGEAQKTPSEQACMFCPVRNHCDRAYHK